MLDTLLLHHLERELRLKKEQWVVHSTVAQRSERIGGLQRLAQSLSTLKRRIRGILSSPQPEREDAEGTEVHVQEEHVALVLQDGRSRRFLLPGRHRLPAGAANVEVRMTSAIRLPSSLTDMQDAHLWPFERAFRYLDGALVEIQVVEPSRPGPLSLPSAEEAHPKVARFVRLQERSRLSASDEDDLLERISFV